MTSPDDTDRQTLDFSDEEEFTSPGIDPKVAEAMESLKRVQKKVTVHVSDIVELVTKKKTSSNPPPAPEGT